MLAPLLFTVGIIVAISAGAKLPAEGAEYPDTWPVFLGASVLAAVGCFLWRKQKAEQRKASNAERGDRKSPFEYIQGVLAPARKLAEDISELTPEQVCVRVDELLSGYLLPLAEVRQGVIDQLGMAKGAEVLVTVAYGERMLNRTWSAAGDGHLPEALSVFPDAVEALEEAASLCADKAAAFA
ncbi:MAG: hypothetical protein ACE366_19940 [Bradymonadia bacterium]